MSTQVNVPDGDTMVIGGVVSDIFREEEDGVPWFADLAEISYQKKLEAAEVIGSDRVRVVDPNFGKDDTAIDFDTFQVPLYRSPERGEVNAEQIGLDAQRRSELLRSGENADSETP